MFAQYVPLCIGFYRRQPIVDDYNRYAIEVKRNPIKFGVKHVTKMNGTSNLPKSPLWLDEVQRFLKYRINGKLYEKEQGLAQYRQNNDVDMTE